MSGSVGEPPPRGGGLASAREDAHRQFSDLFNLVADPAVLLVAWQRVRRNKGARSAGVDGATAFFIEARRGVEPFLADIRHDLKTQQFRPLPVRERMIVRRVALGCIPCSAGRNLEGCSWV